ncbi:sulfotransferase family cytosolic 1B member 1 [Strongylocentrotus purpuratus]|uniref:Sulfotransferase domain-containing protein n=1 Tax=Strongylocentrotus purpuratus TaxID=7668 RepID=A0A7M7MXA6_STRPU|nr:sulfotransferase family cytosolic 1B member 1 [Strongylocentrotus purpuratus]XP_030827916.1 sulfotransferase family cytosolic 1B member 1 [Strongylocentrotus purpuratus]XP_030827917.1 sulfotransferase family cytosolic 1B member 1 [Strongylocentrotus purpuratus]
MAEQDGGEPFVDVMGRFVHDGVTFPDIVMRESLDELKTLDVRPDDVWVCTYPKAGTHFAMEIVALILGDGNPHKINRLTGMSTVAMPVFLPPPPDDQPQGQPLDYLRNQPPILDMIKKAPSPRLIISHLPFQSLPPEIEKRAKVLYVARNPKDMATSTMKFIEKTMPVPGGFPKLLDDLMNGDNLGGWFNHVMDYWNKRDEKNVLFLKYEDMVMDLRSCVKKVAELLEHPLTDDVFEKVVAGSEFKGMKKTYDTLEKSAEKGIFLTRAGGQKEMSFMQTGKIGTWKTKFTVAQSEMVDAWYQEKFAGQELQFQFE